MLSDGDRAWLRELHTDLWPPRDARSDGQKFADRFKSEYLEPGWRPKLPPKPRELLTKEEMDRAFALIDSAPLLTVLCRTGMFGGVGIKLYAHEVYPGTGPEHLLTIAEQHIVRMWDRTRYEHMQGVPPRGRPKRKSSGDCLDEAWNLFTKYTHTPQNRRWIEHYRIEMCFDRVGYQY
jgi:hypothetical protein